MDFYKNGPTFIVPTGMNIRVFTEQYDGWISDLSGNEYWNYNECQSLDPYTTQYIYWDSTLMIIPDSLWTSEPDLGENSDACHIDESINFFGPHKCAHFSECSGARTCTWEGWCTGESGCESEYTAPVVPDHCNYNEALNVNGPNRCLYNNECAGERTCSSVGWCQGVSGCNRLL